MLTTEECPDMNVGTGKFSDDVDVDDVDTSSSSDTLGAHRCHEAMRGHPKREDEVHFGKRGEEA